MDLRARTGSLDAPTESGVLNAATGVIYRENRPRARFSAPLVKASHKTGTVVASNGVKVTSVDPAGIVVTADEITWEADRDLIVARGNVTIRQVPPGATQPTMWGGPYETATINTAMKRFTIP